VIKVIGHTEDGDEGAGTALPAVVVPHAGVALDLGEGALEVSPTAPTSLEAMVRNTGNEPVTVRMYAQASKEGWTVEVSEPSLQLTPGSQAPVLVWVTAPEGVSYQTPARIMVVAASEEGPTLAVEYFTATVGLKVEYEGLFMPMSVPLMDGTAVTDLVLNNNGNSFERLSISFLGLPEGWRAKAAGVTGPIILGPGESRTLEVTITAPRDTMPGRVPVAVQVRGSIGPYSSWCDVHVLQVFDVDLVIEETTRTLTPPATVTFPFEMHSVGNSAGTARLALEGLPYGWDYSFQDADGEPTVMFPMEMGGVRSARLALKVPAGADGDHAIDMVLWSEQEGQLLRQTLYVRLRFPDLTIVDISIFPYEPREGTPLTVRATVINLGMADAEDVTVVLKDGSTVMDRDTLSIVPRMGQLEVVLYMVPDQGRRTLVLQVDPADEIRERNEANNLVKRHVDVDGAPDQAIPPAVVQVSVAAVITVSILGLVGGTEVGRYAFLTVIFLPLYTKIKKDRVLDHYLRGKIHGYIIANPGEHYNAIKDQLDVTNGALSYHLRVLEREGYVRSRMDGIYKRFYPADMKLPHTQHNISSFQEVILTIVKNNQGLSQKDIAKRIGASSQVINYHIKIMEEGNLIKVDRTRRKSRVYATDAPPSTVPTTVD
jgi:predicted transcriptional regulator